MRKFWKSSWFLVLFFALLPGVARAQCGTVGYSVADGRIIGPFDIDNTATQLIYVDVTAGHSYSFEIESPFGGDVPDMQIGVTPCPITDPTGTIDTTDNDPVLTFNGVRKSWTADADSTDFVVAVSIGTTGTYTLTVSDTTMYNPRWSTIGGYTTQWGFQNTSKETVTGNLVIKTTAGAVVSDTTFDVAPGVVVFKTSTKLGIAAGLSGSATFTHNGPPGSIQTDAYLVSSDVKTVVPTKFGPIREAAH